MLYHLFKYFDNVHNLPGAGMFQYISFRAAAAIIIALLIVIVFGRNIINFLRRKQIGEEIRDLGLEGAEGNDHQSPSRGRRVKGRVCRPPVGGHGRAIGGLSPGIREIML